MYGNVCCPRGFHMKFICCHDQLSESSCGHFSLPSLSALLLLRPEALLGGRRRRCNRGNESASPLTDMAAKATVEWPSWVARGRHPGNKGGQEQHQCKTMDAPLGVAQEQHQSRLMLLFWQSDSIRPDATTATSVDQRQGKGGTSGIKSWNAPPCNELSPGPAPCA